MGKKKKKKEKKRVRWSSDYEVSKLMVREQTWTRGRAADDWRTIAGEAGNG